MRTCIVFLFFCSAAAQQASLPNSVRLTPPVQPPAIVTERYAALYPNASPEWRTDGELYRAVVSPAQGSIASVAYFDKAGKLVRADSRATAVPSSTERFLEAFGRKADVWQRTDSAGVESYYAVLDPDTLWFDDLGRFVHRRGQGEAMSPAEAEALVEIASLQIYAATLCELALVNGTDAVRAEARAKIACLRAEQEKLEELAAARTLRLPAEVPVRYQKELARIKALQGNDFDRRYRRSQRRTEKKLSAASAGLARASRDSETAQFSRARTCACVSKS